MTTKRLHKSGGFTLLEMLVTVAVTVVLVLFLNQIFGHMSGAVSAGIATSQIIENNRIVSAQLAADAEQAIGPAANGFLVILQKQYNAEIVQGQPLRPVRSDQVVWIRETQGIEPFCPAGANDFSPPNNNAQFARVWYGHVLRTQDGGTAADPLGAGNNQLASRWVLGREALFLGGVDIINDVHVDSTVFGNPWVIEDNGHADYPNTGVRHYLGYSDQLDRTLDGIDGITAALLASPNPGGLYLFTYGDERPWCNTTHRNTTETFPSSSIAQAHSYLMENVSHFQIDFAGDFLIEAPAMVVDSDLQGIRWYSSFPNNPGMGGAAYNAEDATTYPPPDVSAPPPAPPAQLDGFIEHTGGGDEIDFSRPIYNINPGLPNADNAFVWRNTNLARWPRMIRFRYRLHDREGRMTDKDGRPGKLFEQIISLPIF